MRFIVSQNLADALATILSKNVFASIAYQALTDLLNLPDKTLNAESIKGGIDINTQITLTYRANDYETALWLANMTGIAQKTVTKMEKVEVNKGGAEVWGDERSVGQVEETTVTTNQLLALPARVSALIRPNHLAVIIYTCWITVKEAKGLPPRNPVQPLPYRLNHQQQQHRHLQQHQPLQRKILSIPTLRTQMTHLQA